MVDIAPPNELPFLSQVRTKDRRILYNLVRKHKPERVIEYGTRYGACTYVILSALLKNKTPFEFYPFEKDIDSRESTIRNIEDKLGKKIRVYGAVEKNFFVIPDWLDFGFIDHSHDAETTFFFLGAILPKFRPGSLIGIHDWTNQKHIRMLAEQRIIKRCLKDLPLEKYRFTSEKDSMLSVAWFKKK